MTPRFIFPVHDIASGHEFQVAIDPTWVTETFADTEVTPINDLVGVAKGRLSMSGRDVVVRGKLAAAVAVPCARCLNPARIDVNTELSLLLVPGRPAPRPPSPDAKKPRAPKGTQQAASKPPRNPREEDRDGYEFASDEAEVDTYDGEQVVLDRFLREIILLEVPIFPLCSEACPGIRAIPEPQQQPSVNVDPRLAPLLEIQRNKR